MITFDQGVAELNASDRAIAKAIRAEQTGGNQLADQIINSYAAGASGNAEAQHAFLGMYGAWRNNNANLVGPIAYALSHEAPGGGVDPFAGAPVPQASTIPAVAALAPVAAAATAIPVVAETAKRTRVAWSQPDVVALTKALITLPVEQHEAAFASFVQPGAALSKFDLETIRAKAVELELTPAPPPPAAERELTLDEKNSIGEAILEWIAPESLDKDTRLLRLKYAASAIRDYAKGISV